MFFSFDGGDGVGKSTQLALFCQWLSAGGREVVTCRDPGSTPLGEAIRVLLLANDAPQRSDRSEMFLYMAARAQLVDEFIRPALDAGKVVVCDRYLLANVVYQGHGRGLDPETLWKIGGEATCGLLPDLTFLLDMDPEASRERLGDELDRMEQAGAAFHRRVREGFLIEADKGRCRIMVVDATRPVEEVQAEIQHLAQTVLDE